MELTFIVAEAGLTTEVRYVDRGETITFGPQRAAGEATTSVRGS